MCVRLQEGKVMGIRLAGVWVAATMFAVAGCSVETPDGASADAVAESPAAVADAAPDTAAPATAAVPASSTLLQRASELASAKTLHFEVTGIVTDPHVQIPADDADQYGDVVEKVTLSFDWDVEAGTILGTPAFQNYPATVSNLVGMEATCPPGEMLGPYEHFDVAEMKPNGAGAIELLGRRKHPDTAVAESCGTGRRTYAAADRAVSTWIAPPDLRGLEIAALVPTQTGIKFTPDGMSVVTTAENNNWVWTFTPSAK
jgi:hypothetical protein